MELISLKNLTKRYHQKIVLDNINITFCRGQSVAFIGHNGCGKSTLLKLLSKLVVPTSGIVTYHCPLLFHYVPENFTPASLTGRNYLTHMGALDGLKNKEVQNKIDALGKDFFLAELLDVPMKSLSKGTLQKIGVIQALLKTPDVLLLDEPLSGQDNASQKVFIDKINELRKQDVTIFMSCHEKVLVDAVAEDVYTIENGILTIAEQKNRKQYCLLLENSCDLPVANSMTKYGAYYKLIIYQDECDQRLPKLLQEGWKLRGMYDEENN